MRRIDIKKIVETLQNSNKHLQTLKEIKLITDNKGVPIMFSGNRSVVFKASHKDKIIAIKCYETSTKQFIDGLIESSQYFATLNSPLTNQSNIYPNELVVHDELNDETYELTLETYNWVDGQTIGSELCEAAYLNNQARLNFIIDGFILLAINLLDAEFAHGDLKADNIIIKSDGEFILIDLNNAYIPSFHFSPSKEIGTDGFRHPLRDSSYYNNRIDDYPILVMLTTILTAQKSPQLFFKHYDGEFSIFSPKEIIDGKSKAFTDIQELFHDDIILSHIISLLKSKTPSINDLQWWLKKLVELRQIKDTIGTQLFLDHVSSKYGIADHNHKTTFPAIFSDTNELYGSTVSVKFNGLWGFMSLNGKKQTNFIYEDIRKFSHSRVAVKRLGKYGFLDENLNEVTEFTYDDVNNFSNGYAVVKIADKYGYIDIHGSQATEIIYDFAHNIKDGQAKVRIDKTTTMINFQILLSDKN